MTLDEAQKMVANAIQQRKQFGKMFTVADMPPEFLDALVIVNDAPNEREGQALERIKALIDERDAQHEQLVLANRQLGAAKSRETQLRKQLANLAQATQATITNDDSRQAAAAGQPGNFTG